MKLVIYKIFNFVQNYLISYLVQLLRITFHKILNFRTKFIYFFGSTFLIHCSLSNTSFTVFRPHSPVYCLPPPSLPSPQLGPQFTTPPPPRLLPLPPFNLPSLPVYPPPPDLFTHPGLLYLPNPPSPAYPPASPLPQFTIPLTKKTTSHTQHDFARNLV